MPYDSRPDTIEHISNVRKLINEIVIELLKRADSHDESKLFDPEKTVFDEMTPKLAASTYGSDEYNSFLAEMQPALDHHYKNNPHHPEHYFNALDDMNLIDIVEMFCDWKAATMRHRDGDIIRSIEVNHERFKATQQLSRIFFNTVKKLGW